MSMSSDSGTCIDFRKNYEYPHGDTKSYAAITQYKKFPLFSTAFHYIKESAYPIGYCLSKVKENTKKKILFFFSLYLFFFFFLFSFMFQKQVLSVIWSATLATASSFQLNKRHGGGADHDHGHGHGHDEELDCSGLGLESDWNKQLHIGAIFIVLAVSGLGSFLPVLGQYIPQLHIPRLALTLGKYLGTGVIISTALIHMLPAGAESLNNPCVGARMGNFSGWPGVLAIMAILAMHLMEFLLSSHSMAKHPHSHHADKAEAIESGGSATPSSKQPPNKYDSTRDSDENCDAVAVHTHHTHVHGLSLLDGTSQDAASHISTYILELGICLHSVIIGVTLSVTTGSEFTTLLIAICFHQFCEGLALGSRLAEMRYKRHSFLRAALSAAVFALITPLGMAIGVGVRYSYKPNSPASLISMGVLDSLSAGILLYTGLVNLLAEEFGSLEFRGFKKTLKACCFAACYVGAGIMALIGKWA